LSAKIIIDGVQGFRALEGKHLFTSEPFLISKERIQEFCRSVDNDEWIHWDEDRCRNSQLGAIIMPAFMGPALASKVYFDHVEFNNLNGLFQGTDRIRLLKPIKAGDELVQHWRIERVEDRDQGIAVFYDVIWQVAGHDQPAGVATYIVRYW
jgi:acyl dehydratase